MVRTIILLLISFTLLNLPGCKNKEEKVVIINTTLDSNSLGKGESTFNKEFYIWETFEETKEVKSNE